MSDEAKDPDKEEQPVSGNNLRIPDGASALRFMVGTADGTGYIFFKTLEQARAHPNAALIMEADSGGQILLTCPVSRVHASEEVLHQLACDLETITWGEGGLSKDNLLCDAQILYEPMPPGSRVSGGMGGGVVLEGPWIHEDLHDRGLSAQIEEVLFGKRNRLEAREGVHLERGWTHRNRHFPGE